MKEMWVGYNVGCTLGFHLGHSAWQIDQFPTCWPMNGLFVHWSRGWGVSSFSERLVESVISEHMLWIKFISSQVNQPPCMISQHWFRKWLGALRPHAISWAYVDPGQGCHMVSLGHNELLSIVSCLYGITSHGNTCDADFRVSWAQGLP